MMVGEISRLEYHWRSVGELWEAESLEYITQTTMELLRDMKDIEAHEVT